jgi:hypothetical protein
VGTDYSKPLVDLSAQESVFWMNPATKLIPETASRKERDANLPGLKDPAFPGNPHIEVEDTRRVGQRNHHFALHGHAVTVDFAIEGFAEGDRVRMVAAIGEPNVKLIKKVKTSPIDQTVAAGLFLGAEENCRSKDALKALRDATVIATIFRQSEEVQDLGGALEMYDAALLAEREGRDPDRDEPVLAEGKAEVRMRDDMKEEASVSPFVNQLILGKRTERNSAKYKWPSIERDTLLSLLAMFPDVADRFQLLESPFRDPELR